MTSTRPTSLPQLSSTMAICMATAGRGKGGRESAGAQNVRSRRKQRGTKIRIVTMHCAQT